MQETRVRSLGREGPLEKEMAPTPVYKDTPVSLENLMDREAWWAVNETMSPWLGAAPSHMRKLLSWSSWCGSWSICWPPSLLGTADSGTTLGRSPWERGLHSPLQGLPQPLIMLPVKVLLSRTSVLCRELAPGRPSCHKGSVGAHQSWGCHL